MKMSPDRVPSSHPAPCPKLIMAVIVAVALVGSLAGKAWAQEPSAKGVNFYSVEKEGQLGRTFTARLESGLPVVHEPKLDAYVAQLGSALARYADSPFTYTFTVYEDRRPSADAPQAESRVPSSMALMPVDALRGQAGEPLAVAGGSVFIPLSLLATAPDEAVFAFQLAHAMAHIALRHPTRLATKTELMQISMQVAPNGRGAQNIPMMSALAFSRASEREADYVAVRMVSQAGYSPEAMAAYVGGQHDPKESQVLAARAVPSERAIAIRAEIEKLPAAGYAASTGGFAEARALAAGVR